MRRLLLAALACAYACGPDLDTFHVIRDGVAMPVVVRGPADADTMIVYQHGGPGQADLDGVQAFERTLQRRFLYASWAQRTSEYSTGVVTSHNSTLDDHYADMKAVLHVLRARYPGKRLIALGYSFGGIVTIGHLGSDDAEPVDGVVLMDSPVAGELVQRADFDLIDAFAQQQIGAGNDVSRWQAFHDLAQSQPDAFSRLSARDYFEQYAIKGIEACNDMEKVLKVDDDPDPVTTAGEIDTASEIILPDLFVVNKVIDWLGPALSRFDLRERAGHIQVPTLLLWGEHDCKVAMPAAMALLDSLGPTRKSLQVAPDTGHYMPMQAPDFAASQIEQFIDNL